MDVQLLQCSPKPERLIEYAARVCYNSNDKQTPNSYETFIPMLLSKGHCTPLEHAFCTFQIKGISRSAAQQLLRHRLLSVCQQSQRYVSQEGFSYVMPESVPEESKEEYNKDMQEVQALYAKWKGKGLRNEDARSLLPNACTTELVITGNFREFRHIFETRCTKSAQAEVRDCCGKMLCKLYNTSPVIFKDLYEKFVTKEKAI
jgi:thymidylate synthase (FAD)